MINIVIIVAVNFNKYFIKFKVTSICINDIDVNY